MKFSLPLLAVCLTQLVSAIPSSINKRAVTGYSTVATTGFATQNGGTTGGSGGTVTTVTTLAALTAAVAGDAKKIVIVSGTLTSTESEGVAVKPGSNTSILGAQGATLVNIGIRVLNVENVIVRGLKIQKVLASTDAIAIQASSNVWIDHNDLSSDMDHDKDYYDGLLDITHGCDWITVSYNYLHDHWKASLVGHSDSNSAEDTGHLTVTYHHNYWKNLNSRGPSFRFGTGHIYNNYYDTLNDGINTRDGAQLLIENNVFVNTEDAIYSTDAGYAVATGNDLGIGTNEALVGTITSSSLPYTYTLDAVSALSALTTSAGATVWFSSSTA
ncbi:pectate lyase plyA [Morchella conica CCBAS932]|uniref:pectate lyase n=1 Tax=Morchella conica CCBAS932 TaxID=1392247 RepID=A0A3N4KS93_9PEZI|nr:pectate lyase plyA [Morchella conica CCBAS932]